MFRWYVVNTYSGHENKVKHNLEHRVVSLNQQRSVRQIVVPTESVSEMKDNQKVTVEKRTMPGPGDNRHRPGGSSAVDRDQPRGRRQAQRELNDTTNGASAIIDSSHVTAG